GLLLSVADGPPAVAAGGEGQPAGAVGPAAGEANGGGAVRVAEEHGAAAVGEPALLPLGGGGVRRGRGRHDPDPAEQQLGVGGAWAGLGVGSVLLRRVQCLTRRLPSRTLSFCLAAPHRPLTDRLPRPRASRRAPISQGCMRTSVLANRPQSRKILKSAGNLCFQPC